MPIFEKKEALSGLKPSSALALYGPTEVVP
jgi:hypothetical protein